MKGVSSSRGLSRGKRKVGGGNLRGDNHPCKKNTPGSVVDLSHTRTMGSLVFDPECLHNFLPLREYRMDLGCRALTSAALSGSRS